MYILLLVFQRGMVISEFFIGMLLPRSLKRNAERQVARFLDLYCTSVAGSEFAEVLHPEEGIGDLEAPVACQSI